MPYSHASTLFLITVLLFAAANPLVHGFGLGFGLGLNSRSLSVTGRLCCTPNGNCPGNGVAGAVVSLRCPSLLGRLLGVSTVIGQNTTDANGFFSITVPSVTRLIVVKPIPPCIATVQLPLSSVDCPVLSTTNGVLVSTLRTVGSIFTNIFGTVVNATTTVFVLLRSL